MGVGRLRSKRARHHVDMTKEERGREPRYEGYPIVRTFSLLVPAVIISSITASRKVSKSSPFTIDIRLLPEILLVAVHSNFS